jgi:hypothetical protein
MSESGIANDFISSTTSAALTVASIMDSVWGSNVDLNAPMDATGELNFIK